MKTIISLENGIIIENDIDTNKSTESVEYLSKVKIPTEKDVQNVEKQIGSKYPKQLRDAILKYGYIINKGNEYLGIRHGTDPDKQKMTLCFFGMYEKDGKPNLLYGTEEVSDKTYYPFAHNGMGDYLCVDSDNKLYEYIHDRVKPIVDFAKFYKLPDCKDFNWYLNNVIIGNTRNYYGKLEVTSKESFDLSELISSSEKDVSVLNIPKEIFNIIKKNKNKIIKNFLTGALEYYKNSEYGQFAKEDYGKDISSCNIDDMNKMIRKPIVIYVKNIKPSYFVIGAECILDPEHGIAVGFDKLCNVVAFGEHGDFL